MDMLWIALAVWAAVAAICVVVLLRDLARKNPEIAGMMRLVWIFTVAYSGPLGLSLYWFTGRKQIPDDSVWRRGGRSVAHCYSGCGLGEITGVIITVGLLSLGNWWTAGVTFVLAFAFGYALTVGPLMQDGESLHSALMDALTSETASIAVMEIVAISVDLWLAGKAGMGDPIFWVSLVVSLSCGLLAAWPVNMALVHRGVKEGMGDPREMARG